MNATAGKLSKKPSITVGFYGPRMQAVFHPSTVRILGDMVEQRHSLYVRDGSIGRVCSESDWGYDGCISLRNN
jgi:hypothetical protein